MPPVEPAEQRSFAAEAAALRDIRTFIRDRAARDGVPASTADDIVLAVSEASTNAIVHTDSGVVDVRWHKDDGTVVVWIADHGVFRARAVPPSLDGLGGRGIPLMEALMDEVTVQPGTDARPGTVIRLEKRTA